MLAMADTDSPSGTPVEALLQERARFQQWLAKLDSAAGSAPAGVRQKVRSDYQGRLNAVIEQLKSHAAAIQEELDRYRASQRELDGRRVAAEEELAEAQVRYAVGEYSDDEWGRLSADSNGVLESLQRELGGVGGEIARLVEVQGLIAQPAPPSLPEPELIREPAPEPEQAASPAPAPEPVAASSQSRPAPAIEMLPDPTPDFMAASGSPSVVEPPPDMSAGPAAGAPRFVPKPAAEPAHGRPASKPAGVATKPGVPPLDELAFLKSVGGDKPAAAEDRKPRRSGETSRPAEPVATSAPPAQPSAKPGQASQAKTLKGGECGTLNRPTEWYCERCGAELAAL
jgi:hypothetical protein